MKEGPGDQSVSVCHSFWRTLSCACVQLGHTAVRASFRCPAKRSQLAGCIQGLHTPPKICHLECCNEHVTFGNIIMSMYPSLPNSSLTTFRIPGVFDGALELLIPPACMHSEGYDTCFVNFVWLSLCPSVCPFHIFCHETQRDNKRGIPKGSALHGLGELCKVTAFRVMRENQLKIHYAN